MEEMFYFWMVSKFIQNDNWMKNRRQQLEDQNWVEVCDSSVNTVTTVDSDNTTLFLSQ